MMPVGRTEIPSEIAEVRRRTDPDVQLEGTLRRNTPGLGHNTEHRFDDATIEVDLSDVPAINESMEGMPITARGHFEVQENPELGPSWVFKAHSAEAGAFSGTGGPDRGGTRGS